MNYTVVKETYSKVKMLIRGTRKKRTRRRKRDNSKLRKKDIIREVKGTWKRAKGGNEGGDGAGASEGQGKEEGGDKKKQ